MRFRELYRTVLRHCACSETTIKYLAPFPPIITTGGGWVKPFPSHPGASLFTRTGKKRWTMHAFGKMASDDDQNKYLRASRANPWPPLGS